MPARPSSLIDPAIGHLDDVAQDVAAERPGLLVLLARAADPQHRPPCATGLRGSWGGRRARWCPGPGWEDWFDVLLGGASTSGMISWRNALDRICWPVRWCGLRLPPVTGCR